MLELKKNEINTDVGVGTKFQTLQGVLFPLTSKAHDALAKFCNKQHNYVQLKIGKSKKDFSKLLFTGFKNNFKDLHLLSCRY